jgi:hypothetical protein
MQRKIVFIALAAVLALGQAYQAACMQTSHLQKGFVEPDVVFCFSKPHNTCSIGVKGFLQQKLREGYDDNVIKLVIASQPGTLLKYSLRCWEDLRKQTQWLISRMPRKITKYDHLGVSFIDLTGEYYRALIRVVWVGLDFVTKIEGSLGQYGLPPEFKEHPYASCSVTDTNTGTFCGLLRAEKGRLVPQVRVMQLIEGDPRAIFLTAPNDILTPAVLDTGGIAGMHDYLSKKALVRSKEENKLEKLFLKSGMSAPDFLQNCDFISSDVRMPPNIVLQRVLTSKAVNSETERYSEIVVLGGSQCKAKLVGFVASKQQLEWEERYHKFASLSAQKEIWQALSVVSKKYNISLFLVK